MVIALGSFVVDIIIHPEFICIGNSTFGDNKLTSGCRSYFGRRIDVGKSIDAENLVGADIVGCIIAVDVNGGEISFTHLHTIVVNVVFAIGNRIDNAF